MKGLRLVRRRGIFLLRGCDWPGGGVYSSFITPPKATPLPGAPKDNARLLTSPATTISLLFVFLECLSCTIGRPGCDGGGHNFHNFHPDRLPLGLKRTIPTRGRSRGAGISAH
eukprot:1064048-Pyramimonas_sp.AAC.2